MCISLSFCFVSIRSSWRVRRRSRGQRRRSVAIGEITGSGHDTEKFSVGDVQRSDEPPRQENPYTVPERSSSQRRVREPPVIIGDPTDKNVLAQEHRRRTSSRTSVRQIEDPTPRSSRHSTRRSSNGPVDVPSRNPLDLRIIPMIPQEDSEDILLTMSPHDLQSRPSSRPRPSSHPSYSLTPTHLPVHTISQT